MRNRFSSIAVTRPPSTTLAAECAISLPAMSPPIANGARTSATATAVMTIGVKRPRTPRATSARGVQDGGREALAGPARAQPQPGRRLVGPRPPQLLHPRDEDDRVAD